MTQQQAGIKLHKRLWLNNELGSFYGFRSNKVISLYLFAKKRWVQI